MNSIRPVLLALAIVGTPALPALAQSATHSWTMCTPGSFKSCNSVALTTVPIFSGTTRSGTTVTITMHNLNGQSANDNTLWSGLYEASFIGPHNGTVALDDYFNPAFLALQGGAVGGGYGQGGLSQSPATGTKPGRSTAFWSALDDANYAIVGGCTPGGDIPMGSTYGLVTWLSCGPSAAVSFSFNSLGIIDADGSWVAEIIAIGESGNGWTLADCTSDVSQPTTACDLVAENVTPEPVTIALLGTGLFGVAGARLRKRTRA